jgi:hypothetical protein
MAASDVGGSANPTIAEILTKLGTDPKTGLNPANFRNGYRHLWRGTFRSDYPRRD